MNYRSVVMLGTLVEVTDDAQKRKALDAIVAHIMPGRLEEARPPNDQEMKATTVLKMAIVEASAKIRTGPPGDDDEDYALPVWAGVLPLSIQPGEPARDPLLSEGIALPGYVKRYRRKNEAG
jgi:hypothetical protein